MPNILSVPTKIHMEILVWLVVDRFTKLIEDDELVEDFGEDLEDRFLLQTQTDDGFAPAEMHDTDSIACIAFVFATLAEVAIKPYRAGCSVAHRCWLSHRRVIVHRAAKECLKALEPRVRATRRIMVLARFRAAVWDMMRFIPTLEFECKDKRPRAEAGWDMFLDLTLRFWELDYKAAALRMVSNAQVPPHAVENAVRDIRGKTVDAVKKGVVRPDEQWEVR
jgi:hypothetical protein